MSRVAHPSGNPRIDLGGFREDRSGGALTSAQSSPQGRSRTTREIFFTAADSLEKLSGAQSPAEPPSIRAPGFGSFPILGSGKSPGRQPRVRTSFLNKAAGTEVEKNETSNFVPNHDNYRPPGRGGLRRHHLRFRQLVDTRYRDVKSIVREPSLDSPNLIQPHAHSHLSPEFGGNVFFLRQFLKERLLLNCARIPSEPRKGPARFHFRDSVSFLCSRGKFRWFLH